MKKRPAKTMRTKRPAKTMAVGTLIKDELKAIRATKTRAKRTSAIAIRDAVKKAEYHQQQASAALAEAVSVTKNEIAPSILVECVKALRAIASAPDGTPGRNLKGIARGVLKRVTLADLAKGKRDA